MSRTSEPKPPSPHVTNPPLYKDSLIVTEPTVEAKAPYQPPQPAAGQDLAPLSAKAAMAAGADLDTINTSERLDLSNFKDPNKQGKRKTTFGEKMHWALTYIGGDWLLNSAVGVTFTFITSRTPWAEKYFIPFTEKIFTPVLEPFFRTPAVKEKYLKGAISSCRDFISIMVGGTAINPILTHLEKHENKKGISKFFDTLRYGKDRVEHDPKFKQSYEEIDREPVKDTSSVWYSRFIALAPLLTLATIHSTRKFMESTKTPILKYFSFDNIAKNTKQAAEAIGINPKSKLMTDKIYDESRKIHITRWETLHKIIGFDYGLTIYYAFLHAATFAAVARFRDNNRLKKVEKETTKIEHMVEKQEGPLQELPYTNEKPRLQISQATHHDALIQTNQAAQLS